MFKKAIIIGAGPAGLTAAYELLKRSDIKPIILEKSGDIGGISKTINYKGNRMDIGGHRFFSKSDRVMDWWHNIMSVQPVEDTYTTITYQRKHRTITQEETHRQENGDDKKVMLIRKRLSRIYFLRKFFNYPIQLSIDTLRKLGLVRTIRILLSYLYVQLVPRKPEKSLEDFLINRFGRELYLLFFKDYTEKVWGVPCHEISAEWGAQRIKGVSISKAIKHAAQVMFIRKKGSGDILQKDTETSLIELFLYPALGPGQLWEEVARQIEILGGTILMHQNVKEITMADGKITGVIATDSQREETIKHEGEYFFSTMPIQELIAGINGPVPDDVKEVAVGLQYRDFITVGVLLEKLSTIDIKTGENQTLDLKDTWIYVQEKDVKVGRLQLFNNWSPYMVNKPGTVWIGMEYFCNKDDEFWSMTEEEIKRTAIEELEKMGLARVEDVLDSTVHKIEKTYPAYFGTYNQFGKIRAYVDQFENLFLVGRNGMHKYNNSDHSMLTAMTAVDNICEGIVSKQNIWAINTEQEYHEEKSYKSMANQTSENNSPSYRPAKGFEAGISLKDFLLKTKRIKWSFLIAITVLIVEFIIFKFLYPYPDFIHDDSYSYIEAASNNYDINTYPIGYSKFLRLVSVFTKSDLAVVALQYILIQLSILWLLLTIFYFYQPKRVAQIIMLVFFVCNPIFLFMANYISSDPLFLALSIIWFTILLWIINKPKLIILILYALLCYLTFIIRYNALYYPLVAGIAFLFSRLPLLHKLVSYSAGLVLIGSFIYFSASQYQRATGRNQFSPFTGWQLANNSLYAYRYIDRADRVDVPLRFRRIDQMVRTYFDSSRDVSRHPIEMIEASTAYMWLSNTPLHAYKNEIFKNDSTAGKFERWATMGPLLSDYGNFLIRNYSGAFFIHYLSPNIKNYYTPPLEFLEYYNQGQDSVKQVAKLWFGLKTNKVRTRASDSAIKILYFYPIFCGSITALFLVCSISLIILNGLRTNTLLMRSTLIVCFFWLTNFLFSVFAAPIALRFQIFPNILFFFFTVLLVENIYELAFRTSNIIEKKANALSMI